MFVHLIPVVVKPFLFIVVFIFIILHNRSGVVVCSTTANTSSLTPTEVVHIPEGVDGQDEVEDR